MKKVIISTLAVFAMVATFSVASAATAAEMGSTTLKKGSTGMYVKALQSNLNMCAGQSLSTDGIFGSGTMAGVKAFQVSKALTADGIAGPMTKAALVAACDGSTTTVSTGELCPNGMTLASNCTTAPSTTTTTTGALCPNGMTVASNCSQYPTSTVSSTEGYIADINPDSSNRVSTVYESETNKVIGGLRMTARLADQKVESLRITLKNANVLSSANLAKYASSVSLMDGSTVLSTIPVSALDRSSDDTYTAQFTGLSKVITKDTIGRLYVAVNANGSIDSTDAANASWTLNFVDVRTVSPNGVYIVNSSSPFPISFTGVMFGKFSTSGVKATVTLATSNPLAMTKEVSETTSTNDIKLLDFKVKAEVSNMTLRNVPITIVASQDQATIINTVKLMKGTELVDTLSAIAGPSSNYVFSNLAPSLATVNAGSEVTYSVVVDVKASMNGMTVVYPSGTTTLAANFTSVAAGTWSVQDVNGDQVVNRTGSAAGNTITLAARGVSVAYAAASTGTLAPASAPSTATARTYSVDVNVSAFGDTVYIADIFTLANATGKDSVNAAIAPSSVTISAAPGENITKQGSDFVVNSGETKKFRIAITLIGDSATPKQAKAQVSAFEVKIGSAGAAVTAQPLDVNIFQTSFDTI